MEVLMLSGWGGSRAVLGKVMSAYRRVYGFGHLRTNCGGPRSAPEHHDRFECEIIFTFTLIFYQQCLLHTSRPTDRKLQYFMCITDHHDNWLLAAAAGRMFSER